MASETFEQVLALAQADGGLNPAFKKFLQTKFFVPIQRDPAPDLRLALHVSHNGLLISEVADRVQGDHGHTVSLAGAEIVRHLQADADILIALSDRAFTIARERVQWLKQVVEAAHAKAAQQKAAPAVTPASTDAPAPVPAPAPPQPRRGGVLDIAALRPRTLSIADLGLSLFIPGNWTENGNKRSTFATDPEGGTRIEISGAHRPGMSLPQWVTMRLAQVAYDQRFLQQDGEAYPLEGDDWRGRIQGQAAEFTGVFPGETEESRFMVACFWSEGTVASITIRARAQAFEDSRSLYKWLISRVDIAPAAPANVNVYGAPRADLAMPAGDLGETCDPPVFGFSLEGRIGRLRSLAYCWPLALSLGLMVWLTTLLTKSSYVTIALIIMAALFSLWFSLRLTVLRLHDINLTGKLVILFLALSGLSGVLRNPGFSVTVSLVSMLGMIALFYILPGTEGDNDYGPPPAPNTPLVKIGAYLLIGLQVIAMALPLLGFGSAMLLAMLSS